MNGLPASTRGLLLLVKIHRMMKQEPITCMADNALAARCQSFAARRACVLKRPIFYLAAYIDNNTFLSYYLNHKSIEWFSFHLEGLCLRLCCSSHVPIEQGI